MLFLIGLLIGIVIGVMIGNPEDRPIQEQRDDELKPLARNLFR